MKRGQPLQRHTPLETRTSLKRTEMKRSPSTSRSPMHGERKPRPRRQGISPASPAQREKCRELACVVCRAPAPSEPAHVIARGALTEGQDDARAVVPLCHEHHVAYDQRGFDLLPHLEPWWREELAFAVQRFGLISTLRRVTNDRHASEP